MTLSPHGGPRGRGATTAWGALTIPAGRGPRGTATLTVIDDALYEGGGEDRVDGPARAAMRPVTCWRSRWRRTTSPPAADGAIHAAARGPMAAVDLFGCGSFFSEAISTSYRTLRDSSFTVTNGSVLKRPPGERSQRLFWRSRSPPSLGCGTWWWCCRRRPTARRRGAVCTAGGKALSERLEGDCSLGGTPGRRWFSIVAVGQSLYPKESAPSSRCCARGRRPDF